MDRRGPIGLSMGRDVILEGPQILSYELKRPCKSKRQRIPPS